MESENLIGRLRLRILSQIRGFTAGLFSRSDTSQVFFMLEGQIRISANIRIGSETLYCAYETKILGVFFRVR